LDAELTPLKFKDPDYFYKKTLSLAFIKEEYAKDGTEVAFLWGCPGKPQKQIRATVARVSRITMKNTAMRLLM
jgi:hypothetical protein